MGPGTPPSEHTAPSGSGPAQRNAEPMRLGQSATPALRDWIVAQAQTGMNAEKILQAMLDAGWQAEVAVEALTATVSEALRRQARVEPAALPDPVPVPRVRLDDAALYLDLGDRRAHVIGHLQQPPIVVIGGFLTDEECDQLIADAQPRMARSLTVDTRTGGEEMNDARTSRGMFFSRGETPLVQRIETRIARLLDWPVENGEGIQVLNYQPGAEYRPHYDYFNPSEPGTASILKRGGQRVGTLLMYLNDPAQGGGTTFPDVRLTVAPKRGHAVFFSYDRPHPSTHSLHGGAPVISGEKWIATKWLREREFT